MELKMKWYLNHPRFGKLQEGEQSQPQKTDSRQNLLTPAPPSFFFSLFPALKNIHIRSIITLVNTDAKLLLRFNHSSSFYCASITLYTKLHFHQRLAHQMNWSWIIHFFLIVDFHWLLKCVTILQNKSSRRLQLLLKYLLIFYFHPYYFCHSFSKVGRVNWAGRCPEVQNFLKYKQNCIVNTYNWIINSPLNIVHDPKGL